MSIKPIKKKLEPMGIEVIKKKVDEKKEEVKDFRDEILNVDEKILKRLTKIKAEKKAATPRKKSPKDV
jgi:hypothetical protein